MFLKCRAFALQPESTSHRMPWRPNHCAHSDGGKDTKWCAVRRRIGAGPSAVCSVPHQAGQRRRGCWRLARAIALSLAASSTQAATCAGAPPFTDVSASATDRTQHRMAREPGGHAWLRRNQFLSEPPRDAGIDGPVHEPAAACRLVLRPVRVQQYLGAYTLTTGAVDNAVCQQDVLAAANYHRSISMTTHLSALSAGGAVHDGHSANLLDTRRATWTFPNSYGSSVGFDAAYTGHVTSPATFMLAAGAPLRVAVGAFSVAGATGVAAGVTCFIWSTPKAFREQRRRSMPLKTSPAFARKGPDRVSREPRVATPTIRSSVER